MGKRRIDATSSLPQEEKQGLDVRCLKRPPAVWFIFWRPQKGLYSSLVLGRELGQRDQKSLRTQTKHSNKQERWGLTILGSSVGFLGKRKPKTIFQLSHLHILTVFCAVLTVLFFPLFSSSCVCSSSPLFHKLLSSHFLEAKWSWLCCRSSRCEAVVSQNNFRTMIWRSHCSGVTPLFCWMLRQSSAVAP